MGRSLLRILTAMSLLLWLAAAVAWPVSYWTCGTITRFGPNESETSVSLFWGLLGWYHQASSAAVDVPVNYQWSHSACSTTARILAIGADGDGYHFLGFSFGEGSALWEGDNLPPRLMKYHRVDIPIWFVLLLLSWPIIPWMKSRRRGAVPLNACTQCGYDLRATPDRCPECGTAADSRTV